MGGKKSKLYNVWKGMRQRCRNPRHLAWKNYGGRGITVCPQWDSYAQFVADIGPRPGPNYSINRIDNDGNYEPGNVNWITRKEQIQNRRPRTEWNPKYKRLDQFTYEELETELNRRNTEAHLEARGK